MSIICKVKISRMLSAFPSKASIEMTSILPNQNISVDDSLDIHVDGI